LLHGVDEVITGGIVAVVNTIVINETSSCMIFTTSGGTVYRYLFIAGL